MLKKIILLIVLVTFITFNYSCYSTKMLDINKINPKRNRKAIIIGIVTESGRWIEFEGSDSAKIIDNFIIGEAKDESGELKIVRIPLKEIKKVWMRKLDKTKTFTRIIGVPASLGFIVVMFGFLVSDPFCPFIYSFNGTDFIMEGEPFAGAVSKGLKRCEWSVLKHIKEVNGNFILMITNEVDDIDYIDDIKLIIVDHKPGEIVIPDSEGNVHTINNPVLPSTAYDKQGNDITHLVSEIDDKFWTTKEKNINVFDSRTLRDELILEFPKPENSNRVKLVFRGGNTFWGAGTISRYLKFFGENARMVYQDIKKSGKELGKLKDLLEKNNIFSLDVKVLTENGWKERSLISGAPPLAPDYRVYLLDLHDVPGDSVKIKISPPAAFWKIDYLALDYSENIVLETKELKPLSSKDHSGKDVMKKLEKEDGVYLELRKKGSWAKTIFKAPPLISTFERTIVLKTSGYYEIEIKGSGKIKRNLIEMIYSRPGFFLKHSILEYVSSLK